MAENEPWQWSESTWRSTVERVRAGESLVDRTADRRWPNDARCAALISFDSDHETPALRDNETSPGRMAQGEYGSRVAVPRILDILEKRGIPASFFIPAVCALLRPDEVPAYIDAGHEVAVHGWIHERNAHLSYQQEYDLLSRATDVLEQQAGARPTGIRTPSWDFSESTLDVITSLGFVYDSSLMADEEPYEILAHGKSTGIVEIPVEWIRDDAPYLMMERYSGLRPYIRPRDLLEIWRDEFDAAYRAGGMFQLTLHPHIIGHRSRILVLEELLDYILGFGDVWFATHHAVADHVAGRIPTRRESP